MLGELRLVSMCILLVIGCDQLFIISVVIRNAFV